MQINFWFASILAHSNSDSSSLVHYWEHQHYLLWMRDHQLLRLWSRGMALVIFYAVLQVTQRGCIYTVENHISIYIN